MRARVCSLSVHRPDGGLPQTGPADSAGAQEHRRPAPDQLHQGDNRSGQRVREEWRAAQRNCGEVCALKGEASDIYHNSIYRWYFTSNAHLYMHAHAQQLLLKQMLVWYFNPFALFLRASCVKCVRNESV